MSGFKHGLGEGRRGGATQRDMGEMGGGARASNQEQVTQSLALPVL